jgi:hypothetical protein
LPVALVLPWPPVFFFAGGFPKHEAKRPLLFLLPSVLVMLGIAVYPVGFGL